MKLCGTILLLVAIKILNSEGEVRANNNRYYRDTSWLRHEFLLQTSGRLRACNNPVYIFDKNNTAAAVGMDTEKFHQDGADTASGQQDQGKIFRVSRYDSRGRVQAVQKGKIPSACKPYTSCGTAHTAHGRRCGHLSPV